MEACQVARKQDLPPPGGYKPIPYKRIPAKTLFSGYTMFAGYFGITAFSMYLYAKNYKQITKDEIEMRSAKMAIFPMLLAERDRAFLKQLRKNRDAEIELMKDVPGWEEPSIMELIPRLHLAIRIARNMEEATCLHIRVANFIYHFLASCRGNGLNVNEVGTYYGEKVYKLLPPDTLVEPIFHEYYAHSRSWEWFQRAYLKLRS